MIYTSNDFINIFTANFLKSLQIKSTIPCGVVLLHLVLLIRLTPVQGKGLLAYLMKQAETLRHGLDLASKVGDIGELTWH